MESLENHKDIRETASRFLALDEAIFEIPGEDETLKKIIDQGRYIVEHLPIKPFIENGKEEDRYYKYRFEPTDSPDMEIDIYMPISPEENINPTNTRATKRWTEKIRDMDIEYEAQYIRPLEYHNDKVRYLRALQLLVTKGLQDKYRPDAEVEDNSN